jgi:Protein-tyrosine phosphatase
VQTQVMHVQVPGVTVKCDAHQLLRGTAIERREVSIHVEGHTEPFKCAHYHMLCWPDHGAPKDTGTVREIISAVRDVRTLNKLPVVIISCLY